MKRLIIILLLGFGFVQSQAQTPTKVGSWYIYNNGGYDSLMRIPKDTAKVQPSQKSFVHFATKNNAPYLFIPALDKWVPLGGGSGVSFSSYIQEFTGNSLGEFIISKSPMSGSVAVSINGIEIPPSCISVTVNTVLINTSCTGYAINPADGVVIKYNSTQ